MTALSKSDPELMKLLRETQAHTGLGEKDFSPLLGISPRTLQNWKTGVYRPDQNKRKGIVLACLAIKQTVFPNKKKKATKTKET